MCFSNCNKNDQVITRLMVCQGPRGPIGPTGPTGTSVSVLGSYNSYEDLVKEHAKGNKNDSYLINGDLYVWSDKDNSWVNAGKIEGPKGEKGDTGPTGPTGLNFIRTAYLVTFNDGKEEDGVPVLSGNRLPISRVELDISNLVTLNEVDKTIKFNEIGYYKISFTVSAYPSVTGIDFDPKTDIVSVGFKKINTDEVYVGVGEWVFNGEAIELVASGVISVVDTSSLYELTNLSIKTIYLNTPDIRNIASTSYFSNSLVTMLIEYLGRQI